MTICNCQGWRVDSNSRSQLFTLLARYYESGLSLDAALMEWGQGRGAFKTIAERTAVLLRGGMALDKAGLQTRLLRPWEANLLALGARHGRLDLTLAEVSRYYANSAAWWRKLRTKLLFPGAVLIVGLLVLPLPGLISGEFGLHTYITMNVALVIVTLLGWRWLASADGYPEFLERLLDLTPLGRWLTTYHRIQFLGALAALIDAGVPAQEAVQASLTACRSAKLQARWRKVISGLQVGISLSDSLNRYQVLDEDSYALISSGEASGKLVGMLKHARDKQADNLQIKLDLLAEWLPRLIYLMVVLLLFGWFA